MINSSTAKRQMEQQSNSSMQTSLFPSPPAIANTMLAACAVNKGAKFSDDRKHRYALWRIWDENKPLIMFIGLNPSTANETSDDATIRRVVKFAEKWNYGGVYMMNCFSYVSTNPDDLIDHDCYKNDIWLLLIRNKCQDVIFAWGNFSIVKEKGRDKELIKMFPNAKALIINKDGSPRHPLYVKGDVVPVNVSGHCS